MMFTIQTEKICNSDFDNWNLYFKYHCVYILENGKKAYIGETNDIVRRTEEHTLDTLTNRLRQCNFKKIHIISGPFMEETPAKHYEHLLIKLFRIDHKFEVVNGNDGEKTIYIRRNMFELYFDELWLSLREAGLVKEENYHKIMNTAAYKLSPDTALTELQFETRQCILRVLKTGELEPQRKGDKKRPILINGDAGTGKTVLAVSLLHALKSDNAFIDKKIALVYANSAARKEVQNAIKKFKGLYALDVIPPCRVAKVHYDIIICDEAQRLRRDKNLGHRFRATFLKINQLELMKRFHAKDELDWILINSDYQIFFYDGKQSTSPSDIPMESFEDRILEGGITIRPSSVDHDLFVKNKQDNPLYLDDIFRIAKDPTASINLLRKNVIDSIRGFRPIALKEQMRIRAGDEYISYIFSLLHQTTDTRKTFDNYEFALCSSYAEFDAIMRQRGTEMELCRRGSGYAWEWSGKDGKADIVMDGIKTAWNSQTGGWLRNEDKKDEMGSIYTLSGVDLNYAGVVIGPDLYYDKNDGEIKVDSEAFVDKSVKNGISDEDLKKFVLNSYAVLLTRGILGTYVYVYDEALREYFSRFIPSFNSKNQLLNV